MSLLIAANDMLTTAAALVPASVPDPGAGTMPSGVEAFTTVLGWAEWVGLGAAVVGLC